MKLRRLIYLVVIFTAVALAGNFLQAGGNSRKFSENYPELVCPNVGSAQTQVSLTSSIVWLGSYHLKNTILLKPKPIDCLPIRAQ